MFKKVADWFAPLRIGHIDGVTRDMFTLNGWTPVEWSERSRALNRHMLPSFAEIEKEFVDFSKGAAQAGYVIERKD